MFEAKYLKDASSSFHRGCNSPVFDIMTPDFLANVLKLRVECCSSHQGQTHRIKSFQHNYLTLPLHTLIDVKYSIISAGNSVIKARWFVYLRSLKISLFAVLAVSLLQPSCQIRSNWETDFLCSSLKASFCLFAHFELPHRKSSFSKSKINPVLQWYKTSVL